MNPEALMVTGMIAAFDRSKGRRLCPKNPSPSSGRAGWGASTGAVPWNRPHPRPSPKTGREKKPSIRVGAAVNVGFDQEPCPAAESCAVDLHVFQDALDVV